MNTSWDLTLAIYIINDDTQPKSNGNITVMVEIDLCIYMRRNLRCVVFQTFTDPYRLIPSHLAVGIRNINLASTEILQSCVHL